MFSLKVLGLKHRKEVTNHQTDLGKLILLTNFPKPYKQVLADARESGQDLWDLEYQAFGTSHAEIGAYLMGLWNLETPIIEAIAFHHCPANSMSENMGECDVFMHISLPVPI